MTTMMWGVGGGFVVLVVIVLVVEVVETLVAGLLAVVLVETLVAALVGPHPATPTTNSATAALTSQAVFVVACPTVSAYRFVSSSI
jgi:hypothetical protein